MIRQAALAVLIAMTLLAWPANAQLFPAASESTPLTPGEQVIMDVKLWTVPILVNETCIELPRGDLSVTFQLEGNEGFQPVSFSLDAYRYGPAEPEARIRLDAMVMPSAVRVPLMGGRYCYAVLNNATVPTGTGSGSAGPTAQAQFVRLRMTFLAR